ncbi:MAG: PrsW family intramembrane metalloprotease [Bacteroidetes bacterium]|nr:MAG: PrsW family intramembrane metalloprotease [Bacteroidota bacterium]
MIVTAIFLLGFSPGIFWLWYFYKKDKWEPEPKHLVVKTFFWGLLSAFIAALPELPFGEYRMFSLAFLAPVVEELAKFFAVRYTIYNHIEFDEPMDGITYAAAAALGFASIENSLYLMGSYGFPFTDFMTQEPEASSTRIFSLFVARGLLSVPGHVLFSSSWGFALGWAKFMDKQMARRLLIEGYCIAVLLHGIFNFLGTVAFYGPPLLIGFVLLLWLLVRKKITHALAGSPHIKTSL